MKPAGTPSPVLVPSSLSKETLAFVSETLLDKWHPRYQTRVVPTFSSDQFRPPLRNRRPVQDSQPCLILPPLQVPELPELYLREVSAFRADAAISMAEAAATKLAKSAAKAGVETVRLSGRRKASVPAIGLSLQKQAAASRRWNSGRFQSERLRYISDNKEYQKELARDVSQVLSVQSQSQSRSQSRLATPTNRSPEQRRSSSQCKLRTIGSNLVVSLCQFNHA